MTEKQIAQNIAGAFIIKGASMILALFMMPCYMRYFHDDIVLGVWFTILSVLNWVTMFDLGIGNGLRNKLPDALTKGDKKSATQYISSAYISISIIAIILSIAFFILEPSINWIQVLGVNSKLISRLVVSRSIKIVFIGIIIRFILGVISSILYAVQLSAINNFLALVTNALTLAYILLAPDFGLEKNLTNMSLANIITSNLPLVAITIILFSSKMRDIRPKIKMFDRTKAKEILKIGLVILWLQIVWMVVSSTHPFLISNFIGAAAVVEYQVYSKIFNTIASIFALAITPIWSAVTKAQSEKRYLWIKKLNIILLGCVLGNFILSLLIIPFLQPLVDFWLQDQTITINYKISLIMSIFNTLFLLHNVNTSIGNGMSSFKTQNIWMGIAAILIIPLSYLFCKITNSWTGVIIGCCLAILPYEIIQPIRTNYKMKKWDYMNHI